MRKKWMRIGLAIFGAVVAVVAAGAIVGSATSVPVIEVTRETTATRAQVWELWADVPNRTSWDEDLEWARLDGPFRKGSTGEAKLKGQPSATRFLVTRCEPLEGNTERFFVPFFGKMDWHHAIKETEGGREVVFKVEVSGPSALILAPLMRNVLREDLPPTVDKLVFLAEEG